MILITSTASKDSVRSFYCGHCKRIVGKSTFYEHRDLYGNLSEESTDRTKSYPQHEMEDLENAEEYSSASSAESEYFEDEDLDFFSGEEENSNDDSNLSDLDEQTNDSVNEDSTANRLQVLCLQ